MVRVVMRRENVPGKEPVFEKVGKLSKRNDLPVGEVIFTPHAIEQFSISYKQYIGQELKHPKETAGRILSGASESNAISTNQKIRRLINNNFIPARYFSN